MANNSSIMPREARPEYDSDPTPSEDFVKAYKVNKFLDALDDDWSSPLAIVQYRGGQTEFEIGKRYAASSDSEDRQVGADVLAQLGWSDRTFLDESVAILISLLDDEDENVIADAAIGLGHRCDEQAIPALVRHAVHPNPRVRFGVVFGLSCHADPLAISTLIQLSTDPDVKTRDWAVFGLGSQFQVDTPELREALFQALSDDDEDVRGEALVGLAERRDERVIEALRNEWGQHGLSYYSLEAAQIIASPELGEALAAMEPMLLAAKPTPNNLSRRGEFYQAANACGAIGLVGMVDGVIESSQQCSDGSREKDTPIARALL